MDVTCSTTRYGFIGVGTISNAVIRGMVKAGISNNPVFLSPRGSSRVNAIVEELGSAVTKCSSNQEVVDNSDWVFVGVLPAQTSAALRDLTFKKEHIVVSLVSSASHEELIESCKVVPQENIIRVIPLPAVEHLSGTSVIFPPHPQVKYIFDKLGNGVEVGNLAQFQRMISISCTMGDLYERLNTMERWLIAGTDDGEGKVPEEVAGRFVTSVFKTYITDAVNRCVSVPNGLEELVKEQTPGGMNESVIRFHKERKAYDITTDALNHVHKRLTGAL